MQYLSIPFLVLMIQLNFSNLSELEIDSLEGANGARWEKNHPYQKKEVVIRGFISPCPSGGWVLLGRPNVKSCCVEKSETAGPCIYIDGDWREKGESQAVSMQGIFRVSLEKTGGEPPFKIRYNLDEAKIHTDSSTVPYVSLIFITIGLAAIGIYYLVRDRFHITSYLDWHDDDKRL